MNYQLLSTFLVMIVGGVVWNLITDIRLNGFLCAVYVILTTGGILGAIASTLCIIWL
jgi:hypothetical protein